MHFSAEGLIHVELIDPDTGAPKPLADEATGELVYTHLAREAAPLLRFRSRDHVKVWTSRCGCGSPALRVRCIGRTDDMLIVRGVNVFPSAVREVVARFQPRVTGAIQIRPRARADLDRAGDPGLEARHHLAH
ncbi:MAG TPA: phenylacetate--CoA ligase family protein, partial [Burkholderiales bacterium]|nr:phenylacetate--CoA ligase family protein [Burkholderiales bacterium]